MLDNIAAIRALRAAAISTSLVDIEVSFTVAQNGSGQSVLTIESGVWRDHGLMVGLEVQSGVLDFVVLALDGADMTIDGPPPESPAHLVVGLPARRHWENILFEPEDGRWYVDENYLPGSATLVAGNFEHGELDIYPAYVLQLYGLVGIGADALYAVADRVLSGPFRPGAALPTADGHVLRVRGDTSPYRGQLVALSSSHAVIVITIPLWVRTFT